METTIESNSTILPPFPPTNFHIIYQQYENNFVPGEFNYIKKDSLREMLVNAFQAITFTEKWDFVKKDIDSFMCCVHPDITTISEKMVELGYDYHSGSSFGYTMRAMQHIAKYGEKSYMKMIIEKQK